WRPAGLLPALKANVVIAVPSRRLTAYAVVSGRLTGGEGQARELPALSDQICFNSTASPRWIAASAPKRRAAAEAPAAQRRKVVTPKIAALKISSAGPGRRRPDLGAAQMAQSTMASAGQPISSR